MEGLRQVAVAALLFSGTSSLAQTQTEEEELVFVEVVDSKVQLPLTFVAAACGLTVEQVTAEFVGTIDAACTIQEDLATQIGLADENGAPVDLSRQGFVNVQFPDNDARVQMPIGLAAQLCEMQESELADHSMSVRMVACDLSQEQVEASGLPGLLVSPAEGGDATAEQDGLTGVEVGAGQSNGSVDAQDSSGGG